MSPLAKVMLVAKAAPLRATAHETNGSKHCAISCKKQLVKS